jgi:hypothetical protein
MTARHATTATGAAPAAARTLHGICELTRLRPCGHCPALPHQPCVAAAGGAEGYHLARFAAARATGLLSAADMAAVLDAAGQAFTAATLVCDAFGGLS